MNVPRVYVVDDDADVRIGLTALLEAAHYPAQACASAESFLDSWSGTLPTLAGCLILDLSMPGMDGLALQRRLVEEGAAIPIIFLTGHGEVPDAVAALRSGAVDFLLKPVDGKTLLQRVDACWQAETERVQTLKIRDRLRVGIQRLTAREREILSLALQGKRNRAIAETLRLSGKTVEAHRSRLLLKLDAASIRDWQTLGEQAGLTSAKLVEFLHH